MLAQLIGRQTRLTRSLALLALLLLSAVQAHEAAHSHGVDEPTAHCLLCKGSTDTAPALTSPANTPDLVFSAIFPDSPQAARAAARTCLFARAPPIIS